MADTSCLAPTNPVHHQGMTREQADIKTGSTEYGGGGGGERECVDTLVIKG